MFVALDMATGEQVFATPDDEDHRGFRAMAVDGQGRVLFSRSDGRLARWDPASGQLTDLDVTLSGDFLRAATPPAPDGTVYLATQDPDVLFALDSDGELRELAELAGYTASLAMAPDGGRLWYVPHAHGGAAEVGTPVIEVDTASGEQRTIVELDPLARPVLGLSLGGTYNVAVDAAGSTLYLGMNAGDGAEGESFGEVVLVIVELE
jgi:outer membrane protein assembly factor BamB